MLVLGIKKGEKIYLGDNVSLSFFDHPKHGQVIGIEAPRHINIARESILKPEQIEHREKTIEADKNA